MASTRSRAARGMLGAIGDRYLLADALAEECLTAARLEPTIMYRRLRDVTPRSWPR
jgi:hypothetical protein